ncbi:hypothetical protein HanIR_Chr11g0521161 [Helianthus annuus]|nr:hypothetical protein HanIR_Chr11g0521161 [Helianthus annuus]
MFWREKQQDSSCSSGHQSSCVDVLCLKVVCYRLMFLAFVFDVDVFLSKKHVFDVLYLKLVCYRVMFFVFLFDVVVFLV